MVFKLVEAVASEVTTKSMYEFFGYGLVFSNGDISHMYNILIFGSIIKFVETKRVY